MSKQLTSCCVFPVLAACVTFFLRYPQHLLIAKLYSPFPNGNSFSFSVHADEIILKSTSNPVKTSSQSTLTEAFGAHYSSHLPCVGFIHGIWGADANHSDNVASQADVGYEK